MGSGLWQVGVAIETDQSSAPSVTRVRSLGVDTWYPGRGRGRMRAPVPAVLVPVNKMYLAKWCTAECNTCNRIHLVITYRSIERWLYISGPVPLETHRLSLHSPHPASLRIRHATFTVLLSYDSHCAPPTDRTMNDSSPVTVLEPPYPCIVRPVAGTWPAGFFRH